MRVPRLLAAIRRSRFSGDESAVSAVEFAFILPIMLVLYLAGFEISEGVTINHKVTHATSVLGDLVAQAEEINDADMENIFDAATTILNPYPSELMTIVVSGVAIDEDGVATVTWSDARNRDAFLPGDELVLPEGLAQPNTFLVVAEVHFNYTSPVAYMITGDVDLTDIFYLRPREGTAVVRI